MKQPVWELEYSLEARNYLYDSYPYTEEVMIAIEMLRYDPDAVPPEGYTQIEPGVYLWEVLHHLILFQKLPNAYPQPCLRIGLVKPLA